MVSELVGFLLDFATVLIYATLLIFSIIGAILYCYAYKKMKRSKIIGSISILFIALSIDSFWWLMTTLDHIYYGVNQSGLTGPIAIILIKGLLALGLIRFIVCSIRDESVKDPLSEVGQEKLF